MLPKRKPTALKDYDYSQPGAYFITLCTQNRMPLFGRINPRGEMELSPLGFLVKNRWQALPTRYPNLDTVSHQVCVVMPDHLYAVVHITAGGASPSPTLHQILGAFKSMTTIEINRIRNTPGEKLWQRSANEHVIRNQEDFDSIADYILGNPQRWLEKYGPDRSFR